MQLDLLSLLGPSFHFRSKSTEDGGFDVDFRSDGSTIGFTVSDDYNSGWHHIWVEGGEPKHASGPFPLPPRALTRELIQTLVYGLFSMSWLRRYQLNRAMELLTPAEMDQEDCKVIELMVKRAEQQDRLDELASRIKRVNSA